MKQYKKKTYAKTVKKTVHPRHRSGSKSTIPVHNQKQGKPFDFVADEVVIAAWPHSPTAPNPFVKYAMKHGIEDENGLRVTGVNFNIVNRRGTASMQCTPLNTRVVFDHCNFYCCSENFQVFLPRDTVFKGCTFHTGILLQVGHTCKVVQSHAARSLYFYGESLGNGGCSDIRIVDSSVDGIMYFHHCNKISMENVCHTCYDLQKDSGCTDYMFGGSNVSVSIIDHDGTVELNKCRICAMDVITSSIASMKLNDTDFGHMDISWSTIDALTVQGCGKYGHASAIKMYRTKLTTAPDFTGSVFPVHMFPTECEGKWEGTRDKLTLYKKVWYMPGIIAKLPFFGHMLSSYLPNPIPVIARLRVPAGTPRHLDTSTGKVRVAEATVDGFFKLDKKTHELTEFNSKLGSFRSYHDPSFKYANGKRIRPRKRFDLTDNTCASGIHGFLTPEEADSY